MKAIVKVQAIQLLPNQPTAPGSPNFGSTEDSVIVQLVGDVNINFRTEVSSSPMVGDTFEVELTKLVKLGDPVDIKID